LRSRAKKSCPCNGASGAWRRRMNPLDYDPTYPKNPSTLAENIRKFRKDKGLLIREFAKELGIHKFTLIKWEDGRPPHPRSLPARRASGA
jgi:DNA-binding transcriptional regulator YiaG